MTFRKATEGDIPNIVKMLADDELGSKREDYKVPLPKTYYDAVSYTHLTLPTTPYV